MCSARRLLGAFLVVWLLGSEVPRAQPVLPAIDQLPVLEGSPTGPYEVKEFRFTNNTVFTAEELGRLTRGYLGRRIGSAELEAARVAISSNYWVRGYVNSGAVMDQPPDTNGVVTFRLIEGHLTGFHVRSNRWIHSHFYENRIGLRSSKPLNVNELRDRLQVWRQTYPVEQLNAELRPWGELGEAQLDLTVRERWPYQLGVQYANDRPPSTGAEQVTALAQIDTLTGHNDPFAFSYVIARGNSPGFRDAEFLGVDDLSVAYRYPVSPSDTTVGGRYIRSSASIIEEAFRQLDIVAHSELFGISVSQPVWRTPSRDLSLELVAEHKSNSSFLLGVPYSFSPGAVDGQSALTAIRIAGDLVCRSQRQVLAVRLTLSTGVNALDVTENDRGPDWQFFSLLAQAQYIRRLGASEHQWVTRITGQYTPDPLLSLEQLIIGGVATVRGYRESSLLRDTGILASSELRLALWTRRDGHSVLQLIPFADLGAGWNNDRPTPDPDTIGSIGVGAVFTPMRRMEISAFWGYPFRRIENPGHDLQDDGIHFALRVWAL